MKSEHECLSVLFCSVCCFLFCSVALLWSFCSVLILIWSDPIWSYIFLVLFCSDLFWSDLIWSDLIWSVLFRSVLILSDLFAGAESTWQRCTVCLRRLVGEEPRARPYDQRSPEHSSVGIAICSSVKYWCLKADYISSKTMLPAIK